MWNTVIAAEEVALRLHDADWAIVDCRYDLDDPQAGERAYERSHVAGAVYAHLARDLSGDVTGTNGRHPLPEVPKLVERLGSWGIDGRVQVVAYDGSGGMYASRLWWLLRYVGHDGVAVLDGGLGAWLRLGGAMRSGRETRPRRAFEPAVRPGMLARVDDVAASRDDGRTRLLDARSPERYRGDVEPIDRAAGHIPGATNRHYQRNLSDEGGWKPADVLRAEYVALLEATPPRDVIVYCGSGVTACHDLLAMERADLPGARLYAGSWSEWSADPARAVERG